MTWKDVDRIYRGWSRRPPVHWMVAAYFRLDKTPPKNSDLGEFIGAMGGQVRFK